MWCSVVKPTDQQILKVTTKFLIGHKDVLEQHKTELEKLLQEANVVIGVQKVHVTSFNEFYKNVNQVALITGSNKRWQRGGLDPFTIGGLCFLFVVVCVVCRNGGTWAESGGKRRRTPKARKSKRKSRNYRRKSQRRRR